MTADEVAKDMVDSALKMHHALELGLLESAYQACLAHNLQRRRHRVEREVSVFCYATASSGWSEAIQQNWRRIRSDG